MSEENPNHFIPRVALVVSPANNVMQAFSAVTGNWVSLSGTVQDTGATILAGTNVGLVVSPANNIMHAFSALTGAWKTLTGTVQDSGAIIKAAGNESRWGQVLTYTLSFSAYCRSWGTVTGLTSWS